MLFWLLGLISVLSVLYLDIVFNVWLFYNPRNLNRGLNGSIRLLHEDTRPVCGSDLFEQEES